MIQLSKRLARQAEDFFIKAHQETNQKYGDDDYSVHLHAVANTVRYFAPKIGLTEEETDLAIAAAYGHDAVSDARLTFNDIKKALHNERLAKLCCNLCEDVWGINRDERNSPGYYARINSDKLSVFVKICDRIANVERSLATDSSMLQKYYNEHKKFKESLMNSNNVFDKLWVHLDKQFISYDKLLHEPS